MALIDQLGGQVNKVFSQAFRVLGWVLALGLYALLGAHVHTWFTVIALVIKKRLGTYFSLVWIGIGLSLLYNIVFNHFLAMVIKPGGPRELIKIEKLRLENKHREGRKEAKICLDDKNPEDDRFEGL